jgi:hypothetical protein
MKWGRLGRSVGSVLLLAVAVGLVLIWGGGDTARGAEPADDAGPCTCSPHGPTRLLKPCAGKSEANCTGTDPCLEVSDGTLIEGHCVWSLHELACVCSREKSEPLNPCADREHCEDACLEVHKGLQGEDRVFEGECVEQPFYSAGGGIAEPIVLGPDSAPQAPASSSGHDYTVPLAAAAVGVVMLLALTGGGWYVRRRRLG